MDTKCPLCHSAYTYAVYIYIYTSDLFDSTHVGCPLSHITALKKLRLCPQSENCILPQKLALLTCPVPRLGKGLPEQGQALVWYVWPYLISHCACIYNQ